MPSETLKPPPLKNDCFALPEGTTWTPVSEALAQLQARLRRCVGQEQISVFEACGRVLARDVVAVRSNPPMPNSAVDGYAVRHADVGEGPHSLTLVEGRSAAGDPYLGQVPPGYAVRILTGATMPDGLDTVVLQEDVASDGRSIAFHGPLKPRANARAAGEDVNQGEPILETGRSLTPADLALAAATGVNAIWVYKRLRVAVLSTGDELVDVGDAAEADQVYDANRPMLLSMLSQFGFEAVDMGRAPDNRAALKAYLNEAAEHADVILTSGGASAGDEDHMSALLNEEGAMTLWRLAIKPGRPLALGVWEGTPIFGLPGNPVAAMVCTLVFAKPAMDLLAGVGWGLPVALKIPAGFAKSKKEGRREYLRARMRDGKAEIYKSEGSGRISGLSWAEGLVELPDEAVEIQEGTEVAYYPFSAFGL